MCVELPLRASHVLRIFQVDLVSTMAPIQEEKSGTDKLLTDKNVISISNHGALQELRTPKVESQQGLPT